MKELSIINIDSILRIELQHKVDNLIWSRVWNNIPRLIPDLVYSLVEDEVHK